MQTFNELELANIFSIKSFLNHKVGIRMKDFPNHLETFLISNSILSGGAISSAFYVEEPKDFDIYLKDDSSIKAFKEVCHSDKYKDLIEDADEKYMEVEMKGKLVTVNATTFKNGIQVITREDASSRLEFDFIHCMPWLDLKTNLFYISREQYDCIANKQLVKNPKYKTNLSSRRISKYTERGWRFNEVFNQVE